MSLVATAPSAVPAAAASWTFAPDSPDTTTDASRGVHCVALTLRHAGLRTLDIAWEAAGPIDAPVLLVAGGISADRHVVSSARYPQAGWWQVQAPLLHEGRFRVLAIDWIGSDGTLDAPIDSADQADAVAAVLDHLRIDALQAFVGSSYGAMVGLQFAARHPQRLRQLVAISGVHRSHPYASAWRALQRRALALGALQCDEPAGLALARELAMLSYRTPEEFAERFDAAPQVVNGRVRCAAEDYLDVCGRRYVETTSPTAFARLSESIDLHRVDPSHVRVPTTVVAVAEDRLVPLSDAQALFERLPRGSLEVVHSRYGHDAFLKEDVALDAILRSALYSDGGAA